MAMDISMQRSLNLRSRKQVRISCTSALTAIVAKLLQGIKLSASTLSEFITFLTSSPHSHAISFKEFRDFLLLMPRKASPEEIFRYYKVRKFMGDDGRGAARVNMEGENL